MADNEENTTGRIQYGQNPNANEFFKSSSGYNSIDRLRAEDEESLKKIFSENNDSAYNGEELDGATTNFINTGYKITDGDNTGGYLPVGEIATTETIEEDKESFKRKNSNINAIGNISEEKGLGSTNFDLASPDFWGSIGRTAVTSLPGFSEVADVVNNFIPKTTDFDKSFGSLEEIKSNGNFKKEIPTYRGNLNNEHFYAGTLNSGYYGSLKGSSNLGNGILGVLENAANSLTGGLNIRSEVNFWKGNTTELSDEEILALQAVNFDNIYTSKPGINIKNYTGGNFAAPFSPAGETYDESWEKNIKDLFEDRDKTIGNYKQYENRATIGEYNAIGCLYIEPFYNTNSNVTVFSIPFQFNPEIKEGAIKANYEEEKILGRITSARYYINTDSDPVTLTTKYICTCDQDFKGNDTVANNTINFGKTHLDKDWHEYWTQNELIKIENAYRSLVFPLKDGNYMVRPPVVQIYIGNNKENPTVRNVLTYPLAMPNKKNKNRLEESAQSISGDVYFKHSLSFNETNVDKNEKKGYFNVKRYVVTSVSIEDLENTNGWNYNVNKNIPGTKRGFIVTLSLSETTRNFLDLVPDFKAYYDVWNIKEDKENRILLSSYSNNKLFYSSQDTSELSEDLEKLKNDKQKDLNDAKKQKKAQEKTLRELTKDIKKNEQELDKINNDISKLNTGDLDYIKNNFGSSESLSIWKQEQLEKLTNEKNSILYTISYNNSKKLSLEKNIGSLNYSIENINSYIRNASSAMKTLTLGAY